MRAALVMRRSVVVAGLAAALPGFLFAIPALGHFISGRLISPSASLPRYDSPTRCSP